MTMVNAFDRDASGGLDAERRDLIDRRDRLLGPAYRLFYRRPVHTVRGQGVWLYEADGTALLDGYNNVASVGHCHPHVTEAICRQVRQLNTHTRYLDRTILDYSERLLATMPADLSRIMFTCTGSEANDLALRVARHFTGRQGVIVTANAYHGVTEAVAELSPSLGPQVAPGPRIRTVAPPRGSEPQLFVAEVEAAIADLAAAGFGTAALLVDTIFSSDGLFVDCAESLPRAVDAVRAAGGVFIADEVQAGFGRTGSHLWGFARYGLVPDIVTMGKPMGNGHPVAASVMRPEVAAPFGASMRYFNTFGGNPVSCAAAAAVLDVIEDEGLLANAHRVGTRIEDGLRALAEDQPALGAIRAAGLFAAVDVVTEDGRADAERATRIVNGMRERGVLISATGPEGNVLKIRPPLVFEPQHAEQLLEALGDALND